MAALDHSAPFTDRVIGAVIGFGVLTVIALLYRKVRGREGLGGGDAPMLAGIGAWVGWTTLPLVLLLAALAGIAVALARTGTAATEPLGQMRLPLGTLMALAVPFALFALHWLSAR